MKRVVLLLVCVLTVVVLAGCATPYQRDGGTGGYSEKRLLEYSFRVSFRGNAFTSRQRTSDFCFLRCAEVTLENGYDYFVLVGSVKIEKYKEPTTPCTPHTPDTACDKCGYYYGIRLPIMSGAATYIYAGSRPTNVIYCYKQESGMNESELVFDARSVSKSIRAKYSIRR